MAQSDDALHECELLIYICDAINDYTKSTKNASKLAPNKPDKLQLIQNYWAARLNQTPWMRCSELFGLDAIKEMDEAGFQRILHECEKNPQASIDKALKDKLSKKIDSLVWEGMPKEKLQKQVDTFCNEISNNLKEPRFVAGKELLTTYQFIIEEIISKNFMNTKSWYNITEILAVNTSIAPQTVSEWIPKEEKRTKGEDEKKRIYSIGSKSHRVLQAISVSLCDPTFKLWEKPYTDNWDYIKQCIECFKKNYLASRDIFAKLPTLSELIKTRRRASKEETKFLKDINEKDPRKFIQKINDITEYTDSFLFKALKILYDKAEYQLIDYYIIDKILANFHHNPKLQQEATEFQYFLAHFYGINKPEPNYIKAAKILVDLSQKDPDNFDLQTALISNLLRDAIAKNRTVNQKKAIIEGLEGYANIFQNYPHYYPGTNYAYMISLYEKCFDETYEDDNIDDIYESSKSSLNKDIEREQYWALISDIEFQALNNKFDDTKFNNILTNTKPTKDQLLRTLRQVKFYINTLEAFGKEELVEKSIRELYIKLEKSI